MTGVAVPSMLPLGVLPCCSASRAITTAARARSTIAPVYPSRYSGSAHRHPRLPLIRAHGPRRGPWACRRSSSPRPTKAGRTRPGDVRLLLECLGEHERATVERDHVDLALARADV